MVLIDWLTASPLRNARGIPLLSSSPPGHRRSDEAATTVGAEVEVTNHTADKDDLASCSAASSPRLTDGARRAFALRSQNPIEADDVSGPNRCQRDRTHDGVPTHLV